MLTERQKLGLQGERIAAQWLRRRGWNILQRRFRSGHRDIDLVAAQGDDQGSGRLVAFVEVRTRQSSNWGTPIETVQYWKQRELVQSAKAWIAMNRRSGDTYRFDVLGVLLVGTDAQVQYVPDAFWRPS
ncbi:MAG TPA: YraN family protein [Gemmatimonadaceae bacterium]|jgi:putative endonuclease|nr:YraN family protein [Gemmatimonadaceae bacterium]